MGSRHSLKKRRQPEVLDLHTGDWPNVYRLQRKALLPEERIDKYWFEYCLETGFCVGHLYINTKRTVNHFREVNFRSVASILCCCIDEDGVGTVSIIAVRSKFRNQGYADYLMDCADGLFDKGAVVVKALTRTNNIPALTLFEKHGYKKKGKVPNYFGPGSVAYFLLKERP